MRPWPEPDLLTPNTYAVAPWNSNLAHSLPLLDVHGPSVPGRTKSIEMRKSLIEVLDPPVHDRSCWTGLDFLIRTNNLDGGAL